MDFKWLKTAYQFEAEPGGGGAEPVPAAPASATQTPAAEPVTSPDEPGPAGAATAPPPSDPAAAPVEPDLITTPESIKGMFQPPPVDTRPPPGPPNDGYPSTAPAAPVVPPKVDLPTADEWEMEPGKAAAKLQAHYDWKIHNETAPLHKTIEDQNKRSEATNHAEYARISARVQQSAKSCETAVDGFYAKGSILNRDEQFRNSPEIQRHVEDTINACVGRAMDVADREGDTARLDDITNNPKFLSMVLHMAKGQVEMSEPAIRPGASPQGPQAASLPKGDGLTQEDRDAMAAAKADGVTYTAEEILAAKAMRGE